LGTYTGGVRLAYNNGGGSGQSYSVYGSGSDSGNVNYGVYGDTGSNPHATSYALGAGLNNYNGTAIYSNSSSVTTGKFINLYHSSSAFTGDMIFANMADGSGSFTGNFLNFQKNGVTQFIVKNDGSVGVGTTTTASKLQVAGTITSNNGILNINQTVGTYWATGANPALLFYTNNINRVRIADSGTASFYYPTAFNDKMYVDGGYSNYITNSTYSSGGGTIQIVANSAGVSLANGGTSWGSLSDERAKVLFEPITDAVTKVSTLRTIMGRFKTDDAAKRRPFLIAQDVQKVLPEAIDVGNDGMLNLRYVDMIPLYGAAIKELTSTTEALQGRVNELESKNAVLQNEINSLKNEKF